MKKFIFFANILFVSANVFGMYNNETNCSGSTNPKRPLPDDQESIPCKKNITSVDVFEKSSANKLKRSFSDDMEIEEDNSEKNKVLGCECVDFKKALEKEYSFKNKDSNDVGEGQTMDSVKNSDVLIKQDDGRSGKYRLKY